MYSRPRALSWTLAARSRPRRIEGSETAHAAATRSVRFSSQPPEPARSIPRDDAVVDDQGHALEQRHTGGRERRQRDRARQLEALVGQDREWEMEPLDRFTPVGGILGREAIEIGNREPLELGEMVAERARLRRAAASAWNLIPADGRR